MSYSALLTVLNGTAGSPAPLYRLQGGSPPWRKHLHIEHAPHYHCLTDGKEKYIWFAADGREQFFRLSDDPDECHDLAAAPTEAERLAHWRTLLVKELEGRPEGFTDGTGLIPGRPYSAVYQLP